MKIAVDAMGGDNSPIKIIDGIILKHKKNKENFFKIFGDKDEILKYLGNNINESFYEIVHTKEIVKSTDSPLEVTQN